MRDTVAFGLGMCVLSKLKALIAPAFGAKSKEFQIKQISCELQTSPSCAYAPESEQCKYKFTVHFEVGLYF